MMMMFSSGVNDDDAYARRLINNNDNDNDNDNNNNITITAKQEKQPSIYTRFLSQAQRDIDAPRSKKKDRQGLFDQPTLALNCQKTYKLTVKSSGKATLFVQGNHTEACEQAAANGIIPQQLNPTLKDWIVARLCDRTPVLEIEEIIANSNLHACHGCPIPSNIGPGSRYRPSTSTLRSLASEAKTSRLIDANEQKAVALLIEEMKQNGSLLFYNSGLCTCKVMSLDINLENEYLG